MSQAGAGHVGSWSEGGDSPVITQGPLPSLLSPTDELDSGGSKELRGKVTPWQWPEKRHLPGRISDSAPGPNVH